MQFEQYIESLNEIIGKRFHDKYRIYALRCKDITYFNKKRGVLKSSRKSLTDDEIKKWETTYPHFYYVDAVSYYIYVSFNNQAKNRFIG